MPSLRAFLADRHSGAAELALDALDILDTERKEGTPPARLGRLATRLSRAHPAMGAVWNATRADDPTQFRRQLLRGQAEVVRRARRLLPRRAHIVTLSYSSTVLMALTRKDLQITVAMSEPGGEGRRLARRLRRAGVQARLIPDSVLGLAMRAADLAVVGADAVTPRVVVNKVGTYLLALAARSAGKPCYVLADRAKLVPSSWPVPEFGPGRPFEPTPRSLFDTIVTD